MLNLTKQLLQQVDLSSNNPNLQNIPIKTKLGRETRSAFVPRQKGNLILAADWPIRDYQSSISLSEQISRYLIKIKTLLFALTAAKVFNITYRRRGSINEEKSKRSKFWNNLRYISLYGLLCKILDIALELKLKKL